MIWERLDHIPWVRAIAAEVDPALLAALEGDLTWFGIESGTILFAQGEAGSDCFLLVAGRLGILIDEGTGPQLVGSVAPGSLVGEMAVLTGEPRSATVTAFRDSELVRFPEAAARRLMDASRTLTHVVLRELADRLRRRGEPRARGQPVEALALVPLDRASDAGESRAAFHRGFAALGGPLAVVGDRIAGAVQHDEPPGALTVYDVDWQATTWHRRCVRQADRIVYVADQGTVPDTAIEGEVAVARRLGRPADLVLVHQAARPYPRGATAWLGLFAADRIFHVRAGDAADHARVARMVMGRGIGLVLSGGGARGFAHIGVLRALGDLGIPIDHLCGTSMGSLVAASAALHVDPEEVARHIHHGSVANNPFGDYTLPFVALARGRRMSRLLRSVFGEARIEDTWKSFSCLSANLSTGRTTIHQSGPIWRALRASAAIPGIVPPVVEGGEVLVDGGIMNNLPVDAMRSFARGPVIAVDVTSRAEFRAAEAEIEERSPLWMLGTGRGRFPNLFRLMFRCATIGGSASDGLSRNLADLLIEPELSTVDMLSFKKFDRAVAAGYAATIQAVEASGIRERFTPCPAGAVPPTR